MTKQDLFSMSIWQSIHRDGFKPQRQHRALYSGTTSAVEKQHSISSYHGAAKNAPRSNAVSKRSMKQLGKSFNRKMYINCSRAVAALGTPVETHAGMMQKSEFIKAVNNPAPKARE